MKTHRTFQRLRYLKWAALLAASAASFALFSATGTSPRAAQSEQAERRLEDKIPKHLPIRVRVRNLNSERWLRELAVEVTNTGSKPIYLLRFAVVAPEIKSDGPTRASRRSTTGGPS